MMNIQLESFETCKKCIKINKFPPCGVIKFYKGGELKDILNGNFRDSKEQHFFVCPVDAIKPLGNGMQFLSDKCISCGLCVNKCPYGNIKLENFNKGKIYNYIKSNILQIASFLKTSFETNYEIFTEVKYEGNARNKRIDIVIKSSKTTYLLKVLTGKPTRGKYERDYEKILASVVKDMNIKNIGLIYLYFDNSSINLSNKIKILNNEYIVLRVSLENLISIFEK